MTPWAATAMLDSEQDMLRVDVMLSLDTGPMRGFRSFLVVELDEGHALELLGTIHLALTELRERREALLATRNVVPFPGRLD